MQSKKILLPGILCAMLFDAMAQAPRKTDRQLDSVKVTNRSKAAALQESGFQVNAIDTRKYANTNTDLNQLLNRSAGIKVRESGGLGSDFNFSLNGLSGKSVRFFLDGIPMESFGSSMSLNNIPVNLAERIEVYKGVVPVELGADALGGAVNVVSNQDIKNYLDASYSYGSFNTHRAAVNSKYTFSKSGITLRVSAFWNYSDNDYRMKHVEVANAANTAYDTVDVKRFHNKYWSYMSQAEIGVTNKRWADVFSIGLVYSGFYNDQQTGATQTVVYGKYHSLGNYLMPNLRYRKDHFLVKQLSMNLFAAYARDNNRIVDTSGWVYGWDGKTINSTPRYVGESGSVFSLYKYLNTVKVLRTNFSYRLNDKNSLNLNYTRNYTKRESYNALITDRDDNPSQLGKNIVGLAWQSNLLNNRLSGTVFGKYYGLRTRQAKSVYYVGSGFKTEKVDDLNNYFGYGVALRYKFSEALGLKASFEKSYRLQEITEMFGDGLTVISNPDLRPEHSNNLNLGTYYSLQKGDHHMALEASGFYRDAVDFIFNYPAGAVSQYMNVGKVRITGAEGEVRYNWKRKFNAMVNLTWQNAINSQRYIDGNVNTIDLTYQYKIPNQPWLYGNAELGYTKENWPAKGSQVHFAWFSQYIHWFYLTWSDLGSSQSKNIIPTQFIHNASITYSLKDGRYNITVESLNLTDRLAYDNFRLQKPGRSFSVKCRYVLK